MALFQYDWFLYNKGQLHITKEDHVKTSEKDIHKLRREASEESKLTNTLILVKEEIHFHCLIPSPLIPPSL